MLRFFLSLALAAVCAFGQQPSITNAKLSSVPASGGLNTAIQSAITSNAGPLWIGYAVPAVKGDRQSCCWTNDWRGCGLESQRVFTGQNATGENPRGPVQLEGSAYVAVLLRVDERQVGKIRSFSLDCPLDAGGLTFIWLTGVTPGDSVRWLSNNATESAVNAIAQHAGTEAEQVLTKFATSGETEKVRKSAVFWLAISRGRPGYEVANRVARTDPDDKVREHAIFAMSQSKEPEAIPSIIAIAKEDRSARVRGQALFWLAQKASKQAVASITTAIEQDPDTEVKKKAVFALTQMRDGDGVPLLINVAKNNANPAVRKQAMFWLGQSKDPRALKFFEDILTK